MKKGASASVTTTALPMEGACEAKIQGHSHIHAANCGHKSVVHGDHVCYFHDGHYHYMHDGHSHACEGPKAQAKGPAKVISLADARNSKKK